MKACIHECVGCCIFLVGSKDKCLQSIGTLLNRINSISEKNDKYIPMTERGME